METIERYQNAIEEEERKKEEREGKNIEESWDEIKQIVYEIVLIKKKVKKELELMRQEKEIRS